MHHVKKMNAQKREICMNASALVTGVSPFLTELERLSTDNLRLRWLKLYGNLPITQVSRSLLLQELAYSKFEEETILDLLEADCGVALMELVDATNSEIARVQAVIVALMSRGHTIIHIGTNKTCARYKLTKRA